MILIDVLVIFGKPPQHCPLAKNCYCKLFGLCGLQCTEGMCEGQYERPKYSALPQGWPQVDWLGRPRVYNGPP